MEIVEISPDMTYKHGNLREHIRAWRHDEDEGPHDDEKGAGMAMAYQGRALAAGMARPRRRIASIEKA